MSYRFLAGETVDDAFRRCASEQLDRAIEELTNGVKSDPAEAVHAARKALKKERSLLRLLRRPLDSSERRRQNVALRDAGRRLSGTRDADVMIEALDDLSERYTGQVPHRTFTAIRDSLTAQQQDARRTLSESVATEKVAEVLKVLRQDVGRTRLQSNGWPAVGDGLRQTYRRGRRAFRRARRQPTVENLHEWRKRCKDLWYDLRLLGTTAPHAVKGHAKDAHRLSDLLGDDHDLAVVRDRLTATGIDAPVDLDSVLALIDLRREELEREALALGARVYAEKPGAFANRIHRYWKAWRSEHRSEEAHQPQRVAKRTRMAAVA